MARVSHTKEANKTGDDLRTLKIQTAKYAGEYKVLFSFSNGEERIVDFKPFLDANSQYTMYRELLQPGMFKNFTYNPHYIDWNNVMTFHPIDLYLNALIHSVHDNYL